MQQTLNRQVKDFIINATCDILLINIMWNINPHEVKPFKADFVLIVPHHPAAVELQPCFRVTFVPSNQTKWSYLLHVEQFEANLVDK